MAQRARFPQLRRHGGAGFGVEFRYDDPGAFGDEAAGDRRPDSLTGAGDNRRLPIQPPCHAAPFHQTIDVVRGKAGEFTEPADAQRSSRRSPFLL